MISINQTSDGVMEPGVRVLSASITFSAVFRNAGACCLVLFRLSDGEETVLPFPQETRIGALYTMSVSGIDPAAYAYLFEEDGRRFPDPYARSLVTVKTARGPVRACGFFPVPEEMLPLEDQAPGLPWPDRFLYCLHVKGYTASDTSETLLPGTYQGLAEKISYLQSLGVTDVELLPVYELKETRKRGGTGILYEKYPSDPRTRMAEPDPGRYPVDSFGMPMRKNPDIRDTNYWGFGPGFYEAPRAAYAASGDPQQEFASLVRSFHEAGIRVILQMYFPGAVSTQDQIRALRFYVTRYGVDGFHLKGDVASPASLAQDPVLADTDLIYYGFPYGTEDKGTGPSRLAEYRDDYMKLLRRFVKSDDYCMQDFVREFLQVPDGRGNIRFVSAYEGFTLRDLVSYNEKHNDANGEGGMDGESDNLSWNCGQEGHTARLEVRQLRKQQIKNFLCLLFLSQGTPWMAEGDERFNTRDGNNNPWCQDNETGWVDWTLTDDAAEILHFARVMSDFRKDHAVLRMKTPFRWQDPRGLGFPDLSLHGAEAWKPDLGSFSHSLGVMFCENYAEEERDLSLLYIAINTHWENASLGLPKLPAGFKWDLLADTTLTAGFTDRRTLLPDQHQVVLRPRSIRILRTTWVGIARKVPEAVPVRGRKLPWPGLQPYRHSAMEAEDRRRTASPRFRDRVYRSRTR